MKFSLTFAIVFVFIISSASASSCFITDAPDAPKLEILNGKCHPKMNGNICVDGKWEINAKCGGPKKAAK